MHTFDCQHGRSRRRNPLCRGAAAVIVLLAGAAASGQPAARRDAGPYRDMREIPGRPVGQYVRPLIEAINSGDAGKVRAFLSGAIAPQFNDRYPGGLDQAVLDLVALHTQSETYTLYGIRQYEPPRPANEMVVIVRNQKAARWDAFTLICEAKAPHRITLIRAGLARPPRDAQPDGAITEDRLIAEVQQYLARLAADDAFSGAVLVARGDRVLFKEAYGDASKRFAAANRTNTRFNLGSMNKMFTAVAVARLVEQGKLAYSDTLDKHLGAEWLSDSVRGKIALEHLLTHTSGLGSYFNDTFMKSSRDLFRTVADYRPLVAGETPQFDPGTRWAYSNSGFLLLGAVIEKATGRDYFDAIRELVYAPADMQDTDCYDADLPLPRVAEGYVFEDDGKGGGAYRSNVFMHVIRGGPAGGGYSTVDDLFRFARALRGGKLVAPATLQTLWTPKPSSPQYGYGFGLRGEGVLRSVGHTGGFPGISAVLWIYPERDLTLAVLSNYDRAALSTAELIESWLVRLDA